LSSAALHFHRLHFHRPGNNPTSADDDGMEFLLLAPSLQFDPRWDLKLTVLCPDVLPYQIFFIGKA
jgi:hypothetical protein